MDKQQIETLKKYLGLYRNSLSHNDTEISTAIDLIVTKITSNISNSKKNVKKQDILQLIQAVDEHNFILLRNNNIQVPFDILLNQKDLAKHLQSTETTKYTMNELKIICYAFTKEKNNHILKSCKKDILLNHLHNIIDDYNRSNKLLNNRAC